jgi:hypothetical protein
MFKRKFYVIIGLFFNILLRPVNPHDPSALELNLHLRLLVYKLRQSVF